MVAGVDRYFQIARCFRDEDLRGDRQPEFTQLDLEMSFVDEDAVMAFVEPMVDRGLPPADVPDRPLAETPFPRFTYAEAMERFGSDKPDLRFGMELVDLAPRSRHRGGRSGFRVFDEALARRRRGSRRSWRPGMGGATAPGDRRADRAGQALRRQGPRLAGRRGDRRAVRSSIAKFLGEDGVAAISSAAPAQRPGTSILIVADAPGVTADVLGRLRVELGARLGLADPDVLAYCWVHRFPMYKWDAENGRWDATHNPFSGVLPEDEPLLTTASGDLGEAVAGGSGRPRPGDAVRRRAQRLGAGRRLDPDLTAATCSRAASRCRATRLERMQEKFGAMLEAFEYGAPPHGGIALGIDRWAALLAHQTNIREVMAFPKTQSGADLMLEAPSPPEPAPVRGARAAVRRRCPVDPRPTDP